MQEERDRAGKFFLKQRGKRGIWRICWYDGATRQTASLTTGTSDLEAARQSLCRYALETTQPAQGATDAQLAAVMQSYYIHYAQHLPSAHVQRAAQADALEVWGDPNVSELDRRRQLGLVEALRARNLSDWTIDSRLNRIWAAMNWYRRDHTTLIVPAQIIAEDWKPVLLDNDQVYSLEDLGSLFNACESADTRYSREHWRRFLILAISTCARVSALLELTWSQIDERVGRIHLNPHGRRQTKKRRAIVPICSTLAAELSRWDRTDAHVITYYGRPLATREFYDLLAEKAGVTGGPNVIRHTVRTWLAEVGVPDAEADQFMGHKDEGSHTGARYKHRRPEYLKTVTDGIELLFEALSAFVERPFAGRELVDQPDCAEMQRVNSVTSENTCLRNLLNLERETRLELATPTLARPKDPM